MSILAITTPAQAFASALATVARPALGLGAVASVFMLFKPLTVGLYRAVVIAIRPRPSREQRENRRTLRSVLMLNRMANDLDASQPNQAAELRMLAARG
jgi:hypothetical protein